MKAKMIVMGGLLLAFAGPAFSAVLGGPSGIRPEITAPVITEVEALQSTIDFNKMVVDRPGFLGEPMAYVLARKDWAVKDLTVAEAALTAFKTAGPTKEIVNTAYFKAVLEHPGFLGEPLRYIELRKAEAEKVLAGQ